MSQAGQVRRVSIVWFVASIAFFVFGATLLPHSPHQPYLPHLPSSPHVPYSSSPPSLSAQDAGRTEVLTRRVSDRIRALEEEANRLTGQTRTLLGDLRKLEIERDLQTERAKQSEADAESARIALQETSTALDQLERQRVEQLPDIKARLVELYKSGRGAYARMLLGVSTLREVGRTARAIASLAHLNEERVAAYRRTLAALHEQRDAQARRSHELDALLAQAQQARAAAQRAVTARSALIAEVDRRRDLNAQLIGELQVAREKLEAALTNARSGRPAETVAIPLAAFRGELDWPVAGPISSRFRPQGTEGAAKNGVEISASEGTPVRAVHGGTVQYADALSGYGTLVILDHGANYFSLYGYLASATVMRDQRVESGDELGRVGLAPTGPATLYFELRVDGRSVDPVQWLKAR